VLLYNPYFQFKEKRYS